MPKRSVFSPNPFILYSMFALCKLRATLLPIRLVIHYYVHFLLNRESRGRKPRSPAKLRQAGREMPAHAFVSSGTTRFYRGISSETSFGSVEMDVAMF